MELVEETARWREEETENEWESLALGPGWALLLRAPGQEEGEAMGLPTGVQSWAASGTLCRAGGSGENFPEAGLYSLPTRNSQEPQGEKAELPPDHGSAFPLPSPPTRHLSYRSGKSQWAI